MISGIMHLLSGDIWYFPRFCDVDLIRFFGVVDFPCFSDDVDFPHFRDVVDFPCFSDDVDFPRFRDVVDFPCFSDDADFPCFRDVVDFPRCGLRNRITSSFG